MWLLYVCDTYIQDKFMPGILLLSIYILFVSSIEEFRNTLLKYIQIYKYQESEIKRMFGANPPTQSMFERR